MNSRNPENWRKALIYLHRWMGIVGGVLFVSWFFSGIVFMYWTMPSFSTSDRLSHLVPIDLSTARLDPIDAARNAEINPTRLRVGMYYDGRPIYRFQGNSTVYADTGEVIGGLEADQALELVQRLVPEHAATVRYDAFLEDFDQWTVSGGSRSRMPLHRIAVGNPDDTYYYVSQESGEPVQKTDRNSRFWGYLGAVIHQLYFTPLRRHTELWNQVILWVSVAGILFCLSGLTIGVWGYSIRGRFRQNGKISHSPYSGWMRWHHYAGLIFGLFSFTWIFSGGLAFNSYGWFSSTEPTVQQREAAADGPINIEQLTLEALRRGIAEIVPSFTPKEADVLQFRGGLYLRAADGPAESPLIGLTERGTGTPQGQIQHRMVSLTHPERGTFTKFDDSDMMDIAREAMPGVTIEEATWLHQYDNYYRSREHAQSLPILRVRYADPQETWLYIDPHRGTIAWREERSSRLRRWLYNGLHKFDLPYLYSRRPLWDIVVVVLSVGGLVLSTSSLVPAFRRLRRHASRAYRWIGVKPAPRENERRSV